MSTCTYSDFGNYFFTGMSIFLSFHTFFLSLFEYIKVPNERKAIVTCGSLSIVIQCLHLSWYLLGNIPRTKYQLVIVIILSNVSIYLVTIASIFRYSAILSSKLRPTISLLCISITGIIIFFSGASELRTVMVATELGSFDFGKEAFILLGIPVGHIIFGIVQLKENWAKNSSRRARDMAFLTAGSVLTLIVIVAWIAFFISSLMLKNIIHLIIFLETIAIMAEHNILNLTGHFQHRFESETS